MSNANTMEIFGSFSIGRGILYNLLLAVAAMLVFLSLRHVSFLHLHADALGFDNIILFFCISAFPSILVGALIWGSEGRLRLWQIGLQTVFSSLTSLFLLYAMNEITPHDRQDLMELVLAIGLFHLLKLAYEITTFRDPMLPGATTRVLIAGHGALAEALAKLIHESRGRYFLAGVLKYPVQQKPESASEYRFLKWAKRLKADKLVISLNERRGVFPLQDVLSCKLSGIEVLEGPEMYERLTGKLLIENITPSCFIFSSGFRVTAWLRFWKRAMDICSSLIGLLLFLPVFPFVALAIKLDSPGPVFYCQTRVGKSDKPFVIVKLRTMRQDAETATGAVWSSKGDPRITMLGNVLRKWRVDEIPQFINVLKGEMSLVGPRPERPELVEELKKRIPYYSERHYLKPGVTGWAQICYPYGASVRDSLEKLRYDLYYIKHISLWMDIKIILRTVLVVFFGRGGR